MPRFLYLRHSDGSAGVIQSNELLTLDERRTIQLDAPAFSHGCTADHVQREQPDLIGVVLELSAGWPTAQESKTARQFIDRGVPVWVYWPSEQAVERVDTERLKSWRWHRVAATAHRGLERLNRLRKPGSVAARQRVERARAAIRTLQFSARPVETGWVDGRLPDGGAYLRLDYWVRITSGGSYGHTCFVARELAARSARFKCFLAHNYELLERWGITQETLGGVAEGSEDLLLDATWHYEALLRGRFERERPSFIYERLCLGNFAGAMLSRDLGIPYIVEYNGSEIAMSRSFGAGRMRWETELIAAEDAAFRQASLISVISVPLRDELINRGVDARKILVNPNGADPDLYQPPTPHERHAVRAELGFDEASVVVGFSGTFGRWHGLGVLAEAMPRICAADPRIAFLFVGDGSARTDVEAAVASNRLEDRVRFTGRVPQMDGLRFLGACDAFVSPHDRHMATGRFFGSPTKLFEYMAMGQPIVASDLEQIGEVLTPALRADELAPDLQIQDERAILCPPGDPAAITAAVLWIAAHRASAAALGGNARRAVIDTYSWRRHVERLCTFGSEPIRVGVSLPAPIVDGGHEKSQTQQQWNNSPAGSTYAHAPVPGTLAWFLAVEAHRYGTYAPWMPATMEFAQHANEDVLEIGAGIGTDLAQFAAHGARVTDLDLSAGHLNLAQANFKARGLSGRFLHHDAERLPFDDDSFDVVYSNGVLHHTPDTALAIGEIRRVLRPGGRVIVMMYAEHSMHYWRWLVWDYALNGGLARSMSMGELMSRTVEVSHSNARPLVKVYTAQRLRKLFSRFEDVQIVKRQLMPNELPNRLRFLSLAQAEAMFGWNLILKARKPWRG